MMDDIVVGHRRRNSVRVGGGGGSRRGSRNDAASGGASNRRRRDRVGDDRDSKYSVPTTTAGAAAAAADDDDDDEVFDSDFSSRSTSDDVELADMPSDDDLQDDEETGLTKQDRSRRRRLRRRYSRLDARVAREARVPGMELSVADQSVLKNSIINVFLIGSWYAFSVSISLYNKWMFSGDYLNFSFPLFTTSVHMIVQFSLSCLVLYLFPRFRPRHDALSNPHDSHVLRDGRAAANLDRPLMTKRFYLTRIGPCGAATGLDIGLGNMSLKFITLTFYTMCKSSALGFVLIFAFLFRLESPSVKLVLIISTMTLGVIMMVAGETAFNVLGFVLVISSAFFSGFRWALTQILLLRNPATANPFSSIFYLAPVMFLSLLVIALPVEGVADLLQGLSELFAAKGSLLASAIILFPGLMAFLMTTSEFALLQRTSVVTLSICGIFKEVVTISGAGIVYHDDLTVINVSGLLVTIACIAAYNYLKIKKMRADAKVTEVNNNVSSGSPLPPPANGVLRGDYYQPVLRRPDDQADIIDDVNNVDHDHNHNDEDPPTGSVSSVSFEAKRPSTKVSDRTERVTLGKSIAHGREDDPFASSSRLAAVPAAPAPPAVEPRATRAPTAPAPAPAPAAPTAPTAPAVDPRAPTASRADPPLT